MQASPRVPGGAAEMEQDVRQRDAPPLVVTLILRRLMFQNQVLQHVAFRVCKLSCFCSLHAIC